MTRLRLVFCGFLLSTATVYAGDPFLGKATYQTHCQRCHGEDGRGQGGTAADFRQGGAQWLYRSDPELLTTLRNGMGVMPAYQGLLTDDELLNAITYLRTMP